MDLPNHGAATTDAIDLPDDLSTAKQEVLKEVFGFDGFRPGQEAVVDRLLAGHNVLTVMPTGSGKSLCFQLPALVLGGLTVVVSPLVALMQDQVAALRLAGVAAGAINSARSACRQRGHLATGGGERASPALHGTGASDDAAHAGGPRQAAGAPPGGRRGALHLPVGALLSPRVPRPLTLERCFSEDPHRGADRDRRCGHPPGRDGAALPGRG